MHPADDRSDDTVLLRSQVRARAPVVAAAERLDNGDQAVPPRQRLKGGVDHNAEVLETSVFLNELLVRKGISWTRIFADLEKVVPYNVRVIQIHPTVDAQNKMHLDMQVGAESPEPVIELVKRMAQPPFGKPFPSVQQSPTQAEPLWRYRVSVEYGQKL